MHFRLQHGLSFCFVGEQMVFLDVCEDRYFGLSPSAAVLFAAVATGAADAGDVVGTPVARLVEKCEFPGAIGPAAISVPTQSIRFESERKLSVRSASEIALAHLEALCRLRFQSLHQVLDLTATKPVLCTRRSEVGDAARAFRRSDAFVGRQDRCLLKAIALSIYLRRQGIASQIVLGVALRPFHAHCWVQTDDRLLSDEPDTVSGFVPILAVP
jgi:hypothetical protein